MSFVFVYLKDEIQYTGKQPYSDDINKTDRVGSIKGFQGINVFKMYLIKVISV